VAGPGSAREFDDAVAEVIVGLSPGEVVTYGWVAAEAGYARRAQSVGTFLAHRFGGPHWWRVVGADRRLHAPDAAGQARLLRAEGVEIDHGRVVSPVRRP
jgi:methylated-DNA-protein-cysteine methyltransferase-like protein